MHNWVGRALYKVTSEADVPAGKHELRFEFEPTGEPDLPHGKGAPGRLQLYVDGALVASAEAPTTTPFMLNPGALTCGANPGSPVTPDYPSPFKFTGTLHKSDRGRERRADPRPRGRAARTHGAAVGLGGITI